MIMPIMILIDGNDDNNNRYYYLVTFFVYKCCAKRAKEPFGVVGNIFVPSNSYDDYYS